MILIVGEYSGVSRALREGLLEAGEEVVTVSDGDSRKKIDADITVPTSKIRGFKWFRVVFHWLGLTGFFGAIKLVLHLRTRFTHLDVVHLVNPVAIESLGGLGNIVLVLYLRRSCTVMSLSAVGDDRRWVLACLRGEMPYSPLTRLLERPVRRALKYKFSLRYIFSPIFVLLDKLVLNVTDVIIPGVSDYAIAYANHPKSVEMIPLPVSMESFQPPTKSIYPLKIFHGWQRGRECYKGNDLLHEAVLDCIGKLGAHRVAYETVSGLTFSEYKSRFQHCDIFLDQVFSQGVGMNASMGLTAGKVVFSGFEEMDPVGVNASMCVRQLSEQISALVLDIERVDHLKVRAYEYAVINCSSVVVAKEFIKVWSRISMLRKNSGLSSR